MGDGSVHRFGPGHVTLAEDLTGHGHTTRAVGDQPRVTATIPISQNPFAFGIFIQPAPAPLSPSQMISSLTATVMNFNLDQGIANSLDAKLGAAAAALTAAGANNIGTACNQMGAFINAVQAQSGKKLTVAQANQLIAAANQIKAVLGCP